MSQNPSSSHTRLSLLERARHRDSLAWRDLVDLYGPLVASWCHRCLSDSHAVADCVQDVFTSVSVSLDAFEPQLKAGSFRAWLWTITRNKIRDHYRRIDHPEARGGDSALRELAQLPEKWSDDTSDVTRHEVRALYHRALDLIRSDFQSQTWKAFWMSVVEEQPTDQIAEQLGLSSNGVRQAKSRVLRRLRAELGES